ncbi:SDR family NAD(P)-dependent oxidoreductase, partial [bacterium]
MKTTGNTILITGGGSGIGRALAESFHAAGNQVIIAGRRQSVLDEVVAANPGIKALTLDVESPTAIREFSAKVVAENPDLNVLINNAGIMKQENILEQDEALADVEATITTNLLGPIRLTAALLSHQKAKENGVIINVTSGLAFVPLVSTPTYSATKAAVHSYTQSLRFQLRDTPLQVIELAPPGV